MPLCDHHHPTPALRGPAKQMEIAKRTDDRLGMGHVEGSLGAGGHEEDFGTEAGAVAAEGPKAVAVSEAGTEENTKKAEETRRRRRE